MPNPQPRPPPGRKRRGRGARHGRRGRHRAPPPPGREHRGRDARDGRGWRRAQAATQRRSKTVTEEGKGPTLGQQIQPWEEQIRPPDGRIWPPAAGNGPGGGGSIDGDEESTRLGLRQRGEGRRWERKGTGGRERRRGRRHRRPAANGGPGGVFFCGGGVAPRVAWESAGGLPLHTYLFRTTANQKSWYDKFIACCEFQK